MLVEFLECAIADPQDLAHFADIDKFLWLGSLQGRGSKNADVKSESLPIALVTAPKTKEGKPPKSTETTRNGNSLTYRNRKAHLPSWKAGIVRVPPRLLVDESFKAASFGEWPFFMVTEIPTAVPVGLRKVIALSVVYVRGSLRFTTELTVQRILRASQWAFFTVLAGALLYVAWLQGFTDGYKASWGRPPSLLQVEPNEIPEWQEAFIGSRRAR